MRGREKKRLEDLGCPRAHSKSGNKGAEFHRRWRKPVLARMREIEGQGGIQ